MKTPEPRSAVEQLQNLLINSSWLLTNCFRTRNYALPPWSAITMSGAPRIP